MCKDFIKSQKEVKKQFNIFVNNLKFELKKSISDELYSNLGNNIKNVETENFLKEVMKISVEVYYSIFDFLRNILKQTWIKKKHFKIINYQDFFLKTNAIWTFDDKLQRLYLENQTTHIDINLSESFFTGEKYVSKKKWKELGDFIINNKKAKTEDLFLANSFEHLDLFNSRLALIESVIALEHFLKKDKSKVLKRYFSKEELKIISKLFKKKGQFSVPTEIILLKLNNKLKKQKISSKFILDAIDKRNQIMHNGTKNIDVSESRKLVKNIILFIHFLKNMK